MPASIDAVLAGRLGRLAAGERATLQRAAVVGRVFSRGAVAALAPPDLAVDAHLLALTRRGFVRAVRDPLPGDDAYSFHHVLLRDTAYATLTKNQRADLHQKVAVWLDRDGPGDDALVGYHLERAYRDRAELASGEDEIAALAVAAGERLGAAGTRAWQRSDAAAAARLFERAFALLPADDERRKSLMPEFALTLQRAGRHSRAEKVLAAAVEQAGGPDAALRAAIELAQATFEADPSTGDDALALAHQAIPVLEQQGDRRALARAWVLVSDVYCWRCHFAEMQAAMEEALAHYLATGWSPTFVHDQIGTALYYGPMPVEPATERCRRLADDAPDRASVATITRWLAGLTACDARFDDARRLLEEVDEIEAALPAGSLPGESHVIRIEVERMAGDLSEAATASRVVCHPRARPAVGTCRDQGGRARRRAGVARGARRGGELRGTRPGAGTARGRAGADSLAMGLGEAPRRYGRRWLGRGRPRGGRAVVDDRPHCPPRLAAARPRGDGVATEETPSRARARTSEALALFEAKGHATGARAAQSDTSFT